jgi:CubicO group peptidase (beta-lactamase class C family)
MSREAALQQYFQELEANQQYSGVALITCGERRLFRGAYGYASRAWKIRNTLETRFDTASLTKLFTAAAVLQLIDAGKLGFETQAVETLSLHDTTISPEVNVYHLLTHTSGIGDDADEEAGESYEDLWITRPAYGVRQTADFLPGFIHKPANFPPGQGCRYNNCAFVLLGLMIEQASGLTYREYVQQRIFTPLGMQSCGFFSQDEVNENVAEGCDPIKDEGGRITAWKKNIYAFPPIGSPDSGAYVTAADLDHFLRALQAGQLFSADLLKSMLRPHVYHRTSQAGRRFFSYVLEFLLDSEDRVVFYQKDGVNNGVSAIMRYFPAQDINVVLLSNQSDGVWEPIWYIHEQVQRGVWD